MYMKQICIMTVSKVLPFLLLHFQNLGMDLTEDVDLNIVTVEEEQAVNDGGGRHFGDVKKSIRSREVRTIYEMQDAVNEAGGRNMAQLCCDHNGNVQVLVYDWKKYFEVC